MEDCASILPLPPVPADSVGGGELVPRKRSSSGSMRSSKGHREDEESLWVVRQQMITWQQTAQRAMSKLERVQESRDTLLDEVTQLKRELEESHGRQHELEGELTQALRELGRICLMRSSGQLSPDCAESECQSEPAPVSSLTDAHLADFISCDCPDSVSSRDGTPDEPDSSRCVSTKASSIQREASSVERDGISQEEADDLAARLVGKTMEVVQLKEEQETEARARRVLEAANLRLAEKLAYLSGAMLELQAAVDRRGGEAALTVLREAIMEL